MAIDPRERFLSKVNKTDACWMWIGTVHRNGYGLFTAKRGDKWTKVWAHRQSFEFSERALRPGETIDHLCRNKLCVNPAHLDPCSSGENTIRSPDTITGANVRKTHCPSGHPYSGENLFFYKSTRLCRICTRANNRASRRRRSSALKSAA